jgi:hypothetical protein
MSQELKPKRTIPPERLAVLAKWGGNPHEEEVYWMAEELQRARAQLATHSNAHLLRSHEAEQKVCAEIKEIMETYREQEKSSWGVGTPGGLEHMGDVWRLLKKWDAALTEAAAQKENGNGN